MNIDITSKESALFNQFYCGENYCIHFKPFGGGKELYDYLGDDFFEEFKMAAEKERFRVDFALPFKDKVSFVYEFSEVINPRKNNKSIKNILAKNFKRRHYIEL